MCLPTIHWLLPGKHNMHWWKVAGPEGSPAYQPRTSAGIRSWNQKIIIFTIWNGPATCIKARAEPALLSLPPQLITSHILRHLRLGKRTETDSEYRLVQWADVCMLGGQRCVHGCEDHPNPSYPHPPGMTFGLATLYAAIKSTQAVGPACVPASLLPAAATGTPEWVSLCRDAIFPVNPPCKHLKGT